MIKTLNVGFSTPSDRYTGCAIFHNAGGELVLTSNEGKPQRTSFNTVDIKSHNNFIAAFVKSTFIGATSLMVGNESVEILTEKATKNISSYYIVSGLRTQQEDTLVVINDKQVVLPTKSISTHTVNIPEKYCNDSEINDLLHANNVDVSWLDYSIVAAIVGSRSGYGSIKEASCGKKYLLVDLEYGRLGGKYKSHKRFKKNKFVDSKPDTFKDAYQVLLTV